MFKQIKRYLHIYALFVKNSVMSEMEYRANFIASIFVELAYFFIKVIYVMIIYNANVEINGIQSDTTPLFMGTYMFMTGVYCSLFLPNFLSIPGYIYNGQLDMLITKPVSLKFIVTLRRFGLGFSLPNLIGGIALIIWGWSNSGVSCSIGKLLGFVAFIVIGTLLCYFVFILPQLLSFWIVKNDGIVAVTFSVWDLNQMPMDIYGKYIRFFGIYLLPIFVVANFGPQFVLGRLTPWEIIWSVLSVVIFGLLSQFVWSKAMKKYTSVNN